MNQNQLNDPLQPPQFPPSPSQPPLIRLALFARDCVLSLCMLALWGTLAVLAITAAVVCIRAILWAARLILRAVGV